MEALAAVILAGGKGTRMRSRLPKVLHPLAGKPMIHYPIQLARQVGASPIVVVVGHGAEAVEKSLCGEDLELALQEPQLGSGHALGFAREALRDHRGDLLILCGDMPLLLPETIRGLVSHHRKQGAALTVLTGILGEPSGYGRVIRDAQGRVLRIVEEKDASAQERSINEVNSGTYCARAESIWKALESLSCENAQGEYYLTDVVHLLSLQGVTAYPVHSEEELQGVNDRADLAKVEATVQGRLRLAWMLKGVTLVDPHSVFLEADVKLGRDTTIEPHVVIKGSTRIGEGCHVGTGSYIQDSLLEDGVTVRPYCVITGSLVSRGAQVGPFTHLRPGTQIGPGARVGNFVEVKNSRLGRGTKASHLSYLGDADIGEEVNVGAGTITCNYDGKQKHRTIIEDRAFVGSDTQLVAPVRVGEGAVVGAGSTITEDVPPGALAVARARQVNLSQEAGQRSKKRKS